MLVRLISGSPKVRVSHGEILDTENACWPASRHDFRQPNAFMFLRVKEVSYHTQTFLIVYAHLPWVLFPFATAYSLQDLRRAALSCVAWITTSRVHHFDPSFAALRVVARSFQVLFDEHRPSLCLGSLTDLGAIDAVLPESEDGPRVRGPFAGGAATWKSGFAYEEFVAQQEHRSAAAAPSPRSLSTLAAQLGIQEADLHVLLHDEAYAMPRSDLVPIVPEDDDQVLGAVQVFWNTLPEHRRAPPTPAPVSNAMAPMPFTNRPASTAAPAHHQRDCSEAAIDAGQRLRFRDMLTDPRRAQQLLDYLARLHSALKQGRRLTKPFILLESELKPPYRGRPWDLADWNNVTPLDDSDVDYSEFPTAQTTPKAAAITALLPDHADKRTMWATRFGIPALLDDDMPVAIVISPPNASAMPHLERLAKMDDAAIKDEWATIHSSIPTFPFYAHPYGLDIKFTDEKIKYRETSDYSGPHLPNDDDSYAVNFHAHPDDANLSSINTLRAAAAVARAGARRTGLRPTAVIVDTVAMYKQLLTRQKDRVYQGKIALDSHRLLRILRSEVSDFGPSWLPVAASGFAAAIDSCTRIIFWEWDDRICQMAEKNASSLAAKLCPLSYREWKDERRKSRDLLGEAEQRSTHYNEAYLDDELAFLLHPLRALMFLLIYCRVLRLFGMEPSLGKLRLGDGLTMLGVDFYLEEGACLPTEKKLRLYEAWTTRVIDLVEKGPSVISKQELESFNGSLNFGAFAITDAKIHLQHFFKASAARLSPSLRRKGLRKLHPSSVSHAEAIRDLFRATGGRGLIDDVLEREGQVVEGITDANHTFSDYCGCGGCLVSLGVWWFWEFKDHDVLRRLRVHVLEMIADVINVALVATLSPGVRYKGLIDNQSAMFGIRAQKAADLKLFELLLARHAICRKGNIRLESIDFVPSEKNPTDPISRGDFEDWKRRAKSELGAGNLEGLDLAHSPLTREIQSLISHLCNVADRLSV